MGAVPERRTAAVEFRTLVEVQGPGFLLCSVSGQTVSELEAAAASGPVR